MTLLLFEQRRKTSSLVIDRQMQYIGWNGLAYAGEGPEVLLMLQLLEDLQRVPVTMIDPSQR